MGGSGAKVRSGKLSKLKSAASAKKNAPSFDERMKAKVKMDNRLSGDDLANALDDK